MSNIMMLFAQSRVRRRPAFPEEDVPDCCTLNIETRTTGSHTIGGVTCLQRNTSRDDGCSRSRRSAHRAPSLLPSCGNDRHGAHLRADTGATPDPRIQGPFLILSTPFTASGAVDFDALARQACYVDWCGCPGMIWPQSGDSVDLLTTDEKLQGMEVLAKTARNLRTTALCLGVQGKDTDEMLIYARACREAGTGGVHLATAGLGQDGRRHAPVLAMPSPRSRSGPSSSRRPAAWPTRARSLRWNC